nr:uncharacterized protein LOC122269357 [Parasteatoda tepidariorum]
MLTLLMLLVIYNDGLKFLTYVCSYRWNGAGLQNASIQNQNGDCFVPLEDPLNKIRQISGSREANLNDLHLVHLDLQSAGISFNGDNQNVDIQDNSDQKDEVNISAICSKKQIVECKTRSGKVFSSVGINFSESKTRSGAVYRSPKNAKPSKSKNTPSKRKL